MVPPNGADIRKYTSSYYEKMFVPVLEYTLAAVGILLKLLHLISTELLCLLVHFFWRLTFHLFFSPARLITKSAPEINILGLIVLCMSTVLC